MGFQNFTTTLLILLTFSSFNGGTVIKFVSGQPPDKRLLLELKGNLSYDASLSTKLVHWTESTNHCQWAGVECDSRNRVSGLDLSGEAISGGINSSGSSLFELAHLETLNLAQNSFYPAELPLGFGRLANLRRLNLSNSGFAGRVPPDFSGLTRLVVLDLSSAIYSSIELDGRSLENLIRNFTRLRELYLDGVNISAQGRVWCSAISSSLPNLRVLSLANSYLTGPFDSSLVKLRFLSVIRLDGNTFSCPFPDFFAEFSNLRVLTLSSCDLFGVVPDRLFRIMSLQTVDLSGNRELEGSLPDFPVNGSLQNLLLSYTNFSGNLSESVGNLRMLSNLDLRACRFSGSIPSSITNLSRLTYLDLSLNQFSGSVPSFALLKNLTVINLRGNRLTGRISSSLWEGLESLNFLDLSENLLDGEIPTSPFSLPSLKVIYLSNNRLFGSISNSVNSSYVLEVLDLSVNDLQGPIPRFFFELKNLSSLSLSSNNFNGSIELTDFEKMSNLVNLDLSYNNLSVHVDEKVHMSTLYPRLGTLMLASCNLEKLPLLMNQSSLMMIDFSNNQLNGEIPNWIWEVGDGFLRFLNLSHNQFTNLQEPYDLRSLHYLDLHSNLLTGHIPIPPPLAVLVDFSSNNFSSPLPTDIGNFLMPSLFFSVANNKIGGEIPLSLCNASRLHILDMSNNRLHGQIPSCLLRIAEINVLNLGRNNLGGEIPDDFPVGCVLETLDLGFNVLQGKIPRTLNRCSNIEVLNLGNNVLNDTFPCWLKNMSKLRVIVLRFNNLHGNISCLGENITWHNLQIIDIASNEFNGNLPANFYPRNKEEGPTQQLDHLHFVFLTASGIYYQDSIMVTFKGQELEMEKILTVFTSIDFSNNHFQGAIPESIGRLGSLYVLNFSRNALSGQIPKSIGNIQKLESLDFSFNELMGEIPIELASLNFLSFLNLSYNHLVGRIPRGRQMDTFTESSFIGNEGLCGFPLNKTCSDDVIREDEVDEEEMSLDIGVYVSVLLGFFVGLGFVFWPLVFCERWRMCYNRHVNRFVLMVLRRKDEY
ncbi:receptor like protein 19 [Striga hermonthica]|uniref:Receptor like protein 19 n=1 Tax=Striga hermonthica TaxID=68872 RepID=A0A9N7RLD1_STRHE|nr:receptor like protein 19 [Striga hermonthica]